ncbi:MAG TPA: formate dehydrogenase accessory protein FdhE [Candidatus Deferrimicrobiaceae bacterium]|jgi:FdhE protein
MPQADPLIACLRGIARETPELAEAAALYEELLPPAVGADLGVVPIDLPIHAVHDRLAQGIPLLRGVDLRLDKQSANALFSRLAAGLADRGVAGASPIREAAGSARIDPARFLRDVLAGDRSPVDAVAGRLALKADLLCLLLSTAFRPAFHAWSLELSAVVPDPVPWERLTCFVCGAAATLGELQGRGQAKHLRCGRCGAGWPVPRIRCVACANDDPATLGCLYPEGRDPSARVDVCDRCHAYVKVVVAFDASPFELLPAADLATFPLDCIARERGYHPAADLRP